MAIPAAPSTEFDVARNRAAQQSNAAVQQQREALKRRAAALGNVNTGAFIKQDQMVARDGAKQLADANEGINAAQQMENRRVREATEAREFQTSERLGSQEYASGERTASQGFASGERAASQTFAAGQSAMDRRLAEAGLTGTLGGKATLAGKTYADATAQNKYENAANEKTQLINTITTLKNSGVQPAQIGEMLRSLGLDKIGVDIDEIIGLTEAAPKPVAAAPAPQKQGFTPVAAPGSKGGSFGGRR